MLNEKCSLYERYENTPSATVKKLFYYPQWLGRFVCKDDFIIERNGYKSLLLICTLSGSGEMTYRGKKEVLTPGKIALINCRDKHIYYPLKDWDFEFIHFYGSHCEGIYEHLFESSDSFVFEDGGRIRSKLQSVLSFFKEGIMPDDIAISKHLSDIVYELFSTAQKNRPRLIDGVCEFIEQNITSDITSASVAEHFGFSRAYFSSYFKRSYGTGIHDYIVRCRIAKAKSLMAEECSVADVAEKTGFRDSTTFIRCFRKHEGITPLQYKKKMDG